MNILVYGSGYVGLVTSVCFADSGNKVTCVDVDINKVKELNSGRSIIHEPNLEPLLDKGIRSKQLIFKNNVEEINHEVIFICVGTPDDKSGRADLSFVEVVCDEISRKIKKRIPIFIKSTVPVGTCTLMQQRINKSLSIQNKSFEIEVSSCPEFLREGAAIGDFQKPSRVIIGSNDAESINIAESLFKPFLLMQGKFIVMKKESSELSKYASNAFLATKISFINNLSIFADKTGASIEEVRLGMSDDERIGGKFLFSGIGYGGSCFPKDVKSLISQTRDLNLNSELLDEVEKINFRQIEYFFSLIKKNTNPNMILTILGLSFKPNTDDVRYAPSLSLIRKLEESGFKIRVYDPEAAESFKSVYGKKSLDYFNDLYESIDGTNAIIICTEWKNFLSMDITKIKSIMNGNLIFDGRNCLDREEFENQGFKYFGIGVNGGRVS